MPITEPKAFTIYRTAPDGWAACHKKTGYALHITNGEAKAIQAANAKPEPEG